MFKWEDEMFDLKKIKMDNDCLMCQSKIKKGCYAYGSSYLSSGRICINCMDIFVKNFIESMKQLEKMAKDTLDDLNSNKGKLLKNNLISSV